ncbi:oxaloacetate decarboxylase [Bordetella sp. LUAb4]|uniref:isocitrate lyase/PEP mutase family protein n=1 Tax=Bordetella sp. LUAb4 TaxID=2843195 RepID=UPI001E2E4BB4|nr:isocitrate lyase/PEP mutase family protein [Bordetella sp. LUAb4]
MSIPDAATKRAALRRQLQDESFIIAPAVHDVFSLRLVERAGYRSACISGAMLAMALLGQPDIGLLGLAESVEHCRRLVRVAGIPITADADAGYGNARGAYHTVELFEEAGAAGVNLEDQVVPRRHGAGAGKEVVSVAEMCGKIRAACRARRDTNFLVIVRTDACAVESVDDVLARVLAYEQAGADLILPMAPRGAAEIDSLVRALRIPVTISAGTGLAAAPSAGRVPLARLRELGVRRISLTTLLPAAATAGMEEALQVLQTVGGGGSTARAARLHTPTPSPTTSASSEPGAEPLAAVYGAALLPVLMQAEAQHAFESALLDDGRG